MTSGRLDDRLILLSLAGAEGANVAKVRGSSAELEQEGINLGALGPAARTRVARLPELRALEELDGRSVLVETAVPGIPAAALLASHPGSFAEVVALLAEWLEAWHRATVVRRKPESGELDRYVLSPAKLVAAAIPDGARYLSWLTKRCRELEGTAVPFVPAHDDLTMFNVLVDDGRLGVVDWEAAAEGHLPLTDFVYAVVDAAAATAHYDDRLRAFVRCFFSDSDLARLVTGQQLRLVSALEIPAEVSELSFHACWIRHAANELSRRAGDERAFLPIVERLAAELPAWQNS
jgi:hypothetical protein